MSFLKGLTTTYKWFPCLRMWFRWEWLFNNCNNYAK